MKFKQLRGMFFLGFPKIGATGLAGYGGPHSHQRLAGKTFLQASGEWRADANKRMARL
jgi:hypothetical protein